MTEEQLGKVFQPFSQADSSTTRKYGGTGLGLHICKKLLDMMGGSIIVTSEIDKGSTFTITIPTIKAENFNWIDTQQSIPQKTSTTNSETPKVEGWVLLAEDITANQQLISLYLRKMGVNIKIANNGQEAVEEALAASYDLILMDMQMPVMDGGQATQKLRNQGYNKPIIALTANVMKKEIDQYMQIGCNGYLAKPIQQDEFNKTLAAYLTPRQHHDNDTSPLISDVLTDAPDMAELVQAFVKKLPDYLGKLINALENRNYKELTTIAHTLKGLGGGFGYPQVSSLACKMESEVTHSNDRAIETLLNEIKLLVKRIEAGVE